MATDTPLIGLVTPSEAKALARRYREDTEARETAEVMAVITEVLADIRHLALKGHVTCCCRRFCDRAKCIELAKQLRDLGWTAQAQTEVGVNSAKWLVRIDW